MTNSERDGVSTRDLGFDVFAFFVGLTLGALSVLVLTAGAWAVPLEKLRCARALDSALTAQDSLAIVMEHGVAACRGDS